MGNGAHGIGGHPVSKDGGEFGEIQPVHEVEDGDLYRFATAYAFRWRDPTAEHEARVTELQARGTQLIDEARAARRETARTRIEADIWRERALSFEATLRRIDPAWRDA